MSYNTINFTLADKVFLLQMTCLMSSLAGDEAFPLKPYFMRPIPGWHIHAKNDQSRIYNYRIARARTVVENAFGKYSIYIIKLDITVY